MKLYIILAAFLGTIAFSVLYHIPAKYWLSCGLIGTAGWIIYSYFSPLLGYTFGIFLATCTVTFLSRFTAVRLKTPEIVFLISGIFTIVPGADIYWTVYYLVSEQLDKALVSSGNAFKACLGIVYGIIFIHALPQKLFVKLNRGGKDERR